MAAPTKDAIELTTDRAKPLASQPSLPASPTPRNGAVSMEIPVRICGSRVITLANGITEHTGFFSEDTETLIVFPQCGVVRVASNVAPGDVLSLTNLSTGQEVVCRVVRVKSSANAKSCAEIEFTRPAHRFWGIDFPGAMLKPSGPSHATAPAAEPNVKREPAVPLSPVPAAAPISVGKAPAAAPPSSKATSGESLRSEEIKPTIVPLIPAAIVETKDGKQTLESASSALTAIPASESSAPRTSSTTFKPVPPLTATPASKSSAPVAGPEALQLAGERVLPLTIVEPKGKEQPVEAGSSAALASPVSADKAPPTAPPSWEDVPRVSFPWVASPSPVRPVTLPATPGPREREQVVELASSVGECTAPLAPPLSFDEFTATLRAALDRQDAVERAVRTRRARRSWMPAVYISLVVLVAVAGIAYYQHLSRSVSLMPASSAPIAIEGPPQSTPNSSGTQVQPNLYSAAPLGAQGQHSISTTTPASVPAERATLRPPARNSSAGKLTLRGAQPPKVAVPGENTPPPVVAEVPGGMSANQASSVLGAIVPQVSRGGPMLTPLPPKAHSPASVVGGRVQPPRLLSSVLPVYPATAKQARVEGDVAIQADIDAGGNVAHMKVVSGPLPLREAATDALRRWKYKPSRLNDIPVPVQLQVVIKFRLK